MILAQLTDIQIKNPKIEIRQSIILTCGFAKPVQRCARICWHSPAGKRKYSEIHLGGRVAFACTLLKPLVRFPQSTRCLRRLGERNSLLVFARASLFG